MGWKVSVLASMCVAASNAAAETSLTATGATDYDFRGVSQTSGQAPVQVGLDYAAESFRAFVWGSTVDFGPDVDGNLEVDFGGAFTHTTTTTNVNVEVGAVWYAYPGSKMHAGASGNAADDVVAIPEYLELYTGVSKGLAAFKYWYAPNLYDSGRAGSYLEASLTFDLPAHLSLLVHAGHSFGQYYDALETAGGDRARYRDYSVGIVRSIRRVDLAARYIRTDTAPAFRISSGPSRNDSRFVLSVGTTFAMGSGTRE